MVLVTCKNQENTDCFVFQKEKKSFSKLSILKCILVKVFSVVLKLSLYSFQLNFLTTLLEPKFFLIL